MDGADPHRKSSETRSGVGQTGSEMNAHNFIAKNSTVQLQVKRSESTLLGFQFPTRLRDFGKVTSLYMLGYILSSK